VPCHTAPVHVVLVVPGGVDRSGVERVIPALLSLIERLAADHRVTVVALGQEPDASTFSLLGATIVNVPPERRGPHRLARQVVRAVRAVGSQGRPDVVHAWWASVTGLAAVAAGRRYGVPSTVHVAGGELVALRDIGYGGALGRLGPVITKQVLTRATHVSVATDWMRDHVTEAGFRVDDVVPLGADRRWFAPTADPPEPGRLVHVASLNRVKDQPTILRALAIARREIPHLHLHLAGVDTLDGEIQRLAADLGLADATTFHGFVAHRDLAPLLQRAQLHVMASRHEAGPLVALEAALCGVPTVGTPVGHIADLAALDPPAASVSPVADPEALAAALCVLVSDDGCRRAMGASARSWAERHDADLTARRFGEIYARLAAS
jgi:glycosyltransferase involved in cell wall biosynthesis